MRANYPDSIPFIIVAIQNLYVSTKLSNKTPSPYKLDMCTFIPMFVYLYILKLVKYL